ncbi:MAG: hypothetical protein C4297_07860 [Gemmataceae bacterium]
MTRSKTYFDWWAAWVLLTCAPMGLSAGTFSLTNGQLTLEVLGDTIGDSGAIYEATLGTVGYYRHSGLVADWGVQYGTNIGTFNLNTTSNTSNIVVGVTNPPGKIVVAGTLSMLGFPPITLERVYELVSGVNVVRIQTTITNIGNDPANVVYFDTYDPDQGVPLSLTFTTVNDVFSVATASGTALAGRASAPGTPAYTVIMGGLDSGMRVGFGGGSSPFDLGINDGMELNTFMATPYDPNGATADIGIAVGVSLALPAGQSVTYTYYQAYGPTFDAALADFVTALGGPAGGGIIPEPTTLALASVGLVLLSLPCYRSTRKLCR